jgi:hypothetical protein
LSAFYSVFAGRGWRFATRLLIVVVQVAEPRL